MLNRAELLNRLNLKTETIELSDGSSVRVAELSGPDYLKIWGSDRFAGSNDDVDMSKLAPALIAACVVDQDNNRIFTDDDIQVISRGNKDLFMQLSTAVLRINGLGGGAVKNFEGTESGDSSTGSVSVSDTATPTNSQTD